MSSSICQHFTQNAWKKDLCSNCFKSKDEHKQAAAAAASAISKYTSLHTFSTASSNKLETTKQKTDYPNRNKTPGKSIIKRALATATNHGKASKHKSHKVSFPKNLSEVIGYGGEWSDNDSDDDDFDFVNIGNERDDLAITISDDEETIELKRLTRANTDFNMNNGNLLGDPQENIKKSFAALKLGAPQVDKEGKKQTLKISVVPFGVNSPIKVTKSANGSQAVTKSSELINHNNSSNAMASTTTKAKFDTKTNEVNELITKQASALLTANKKTTVVSSSSSSSTASVALKSSSETRKTEQFLTLEHQVKNVTKSSITTTLTQKLSSSTNDDDGKNSPPIERAMEKSLLDEISETLEQQQKETKKLNDEMDKSKASTNSNTSSTNNSVNSGSKVKFEITSLNESVDNKSFLELKKPIARNPPITKDHAKPKVNVFHKYSDTDSNCSDNENGISAYYDVVETQISYENLPDGKYGSVNLPQKEESEKKSIYSSSQYITDMLLSSKTRAASYNLHEGNFMTSKITSDGLIVTKCSSDDALDSTGSSFDGSSDEETSYNMIRSESDSGIGISIGNEYKNVNIVKEKIEKKLSASTNNSDYEDIQIADQVQAPPPPVLLTKSSLPSTSSSTTVPKSSFSLEKSRELHGEPDGSADPDGSLETNQNNNLLPALPKTPPPTKQIDARPSFLHGLQKPPPIMLKKPDVPAKPLVSPVASPLKTFMTKRLANNTEQQQVINQLQNVFNKTQENDSSSNELNKDDGKLKKGKAPNPPPAPSSDQKSSAPPTPERDYSLILEFETATNKEKQNSNENKTLEESFKFEEKINEEKHSSTVKETKTHTLNSNDVNLTESNKSLPAETESKCHDNLKPATTAVSSTSSSLYTRKITASSVNQNSSNNKTSSSSSSSSPVIREKDKRERATLNPKFRSLNTFVMQRAHAVKNLQLQTASPSLSGKKPMTPEPSPRNNFKNLSLSQENLAASNSSLKTSANSSIPNLNEAATSSTNMQPVVIQKTKAKFSIKKFLRMGASKTTDNLQKKESVYSEICTGDDGNVVGKPRLVIIHPIDINPMAVEVVKDITKTNDSVNAQTIAVVTSNPPAPPLRSNDGQRAHEINKPARPPPPKSAELRRKQQKITLCPTSSNGESSGSIKSKSDNVYANLGEIRSSIAPRKPERTASMREREAQLELARKRHNGSFNENADTISICSSNGDNVTAKDTYKKSNPNTISHTNSTNNSIESAVTGGIELSSRRNGSNEGSVTDGKSQSSNSRSNTFEKMKVKTLQTTNSNNLDIFDTRNNGNLNNTNSMSKLESEMNDENNPNSRPSSLKDSVRKISSTIDSYLKDKREYENMYEFVKSPSSPPPPPARSVDLATNGQRLIPARRNNHMYSDTVSVASYTRSEFGPTRNYGLNNSLANIPRMISASYCGSEVGEFDIYAPYSYYGSETGGDIANDINDSVWGVHSAVKNRTKATNRLRMRKGRSVVHKNIEDNYTAVVVANHEALAQVLDQLQQTPIVPLALRPLANAINLRFEDFTIIDGAQAFVVGKKAFHAAVWTSAPVTLALSADCNQLSGVGGELNQLSGGVSGVLNPITEFCDLVPSYHLPLMPSTEVTMLQATISVLPRLQLETLQSIGAILKGKSQVLDKSNFNFRGSIPNLANGKDAASGQALRNVVSVQNLSTLNEESSMDLKSSSNNNDNSSNSASTMANMPAFDDVMTREVAFIMLQLVNGMKNLQVKAIEEMPLSLTNVVLSKDMDNKDAQARLCVLHCNNNDEEEPMGNLCKCAHTALTEMLPTTKVTPIVADILKQDRAESLSKVKSVLEFILWGPSDVVLSGTVKERELALQRWLDLERATVLHGLVRTRVELTVYDECHLMFLVRSTAKIMNDAAKIVYNYQQDSATTTTLNQNE